MGVLGEIDPALAAVRDGPQDPVLVAPQAGQYPSTGTRPTV
jgi:hypothetical protein